jgi:hypothetical protein
MVAKATNKDFLKLISEEAIFSEAVFTQALID